MCKDKDKEILQHRIKTMEDKIKTFKKYKISDGIISKLEVKRAKYEAKLADVGT